MIASFGGRDTEHLFRFRTRPPRMPPDIVKAALRRLDYLDHAAELSDLRIPPGNRLETLRGSFAGFYSIRADDQWRVIFRWLDGNALDVRVIDYHS